MVDRTFGTGLANSGSGSSRNRLRYRHEGSLQRRLDASILTQGNRHIESERVDEALLKFKGGYHRGTKKALENKTSHLQVLGTQLRCDGAVVRQHAVGRRFADRPSLPRPAVFVV